MGFIFGRTFANTIRGDYTFRSPVGASGTFYVGGYYDAPAADANLTQASATVNYGTANAPYAAHAFAVFGGAGSASGGTGLVQLKVSGTSIDDSETRTTGDSEVIKLDITNASTDEYVESSKKWLGQVTWTIEPGPASTQTTYAADFNYGLCKYEDFGNRNFTVTLLEAVGLARANDSGFNFRLLHHNDTGWTYSAAAFAPGNSSFFDLSSVHGGDDDLVSGEDFAFKSTSINEAVAGSNSEGVICEVTTTTNNSVERMDVHLEGLVTG